MGASAVGNLAPAAGESGTTRAGGSGGSAREEEEEATRATSEGAVEAKRDAKQTAKRAEAGAEADGTGCEFTGKRVVGQEEWVSEWQGGRVAGRVARERAG